MTTWFCDAYASWQRGGIENANGRLRRAGFAISPVQAGVSTLKIRS